LCNQNVLSAKSASNFEVNELYNFDEQLAKEAQELDFVNIDEERVEFLHVLADGWAGKLK